MEVFEDNNREYSAQRIFWIGCLQIAAAVPADVNRKSEATKGGGSKNRQEIDKAIDKGEIQRMWNDTEPKFMDRITKAYVK